MTIQNFNPVIALASDPIIFDLSEKIGKSFDLHIDQIGELDSAIREILKGTIDPSKFNDRIIQKLEISRGLADKIVEKINVELPPIIKSKIFEGPNQPTAESKQVVQNNQIPTTPVPSSPHADLEQAGDFKIENEASTDNSYSLKSTQRKSTFVIEPKKEQPMSKLADMAMFIPKTEETEQLPKAEPEKPTLAQETVPTNVEQSTQETKPVSTHTEQIVREYPIQKTPEPNYEPKKDSVPAFDPKNFYNFSNIETDSNIAKIENEFKKDNVKENDTKADNNLKSDSVTDSGQVFQKSASQIHYEKEAKNKHSKMSASQSYQPKIKEFVKTDTTQKDIDAEKIKNDIEKENTALIDELIAHPKPVITTTAEVKQMEPEKTSVVTEKTAVVTENKKTVEAPINLPVEPVTPVINLVNNPVADTKTEKPVEFKENKELSTKEFSAKDISTNAILTKKEESVANKFVSAFDNKVEETKGEIETKVAKVETAPIIIPAIDPDVPPLVNLINRPTISAEELPVKKIPTKTAPTENTPANNMPSVSISTSKVPTNEDIRRDIRSKVSEFNPTTKWASSIPTTPTTNIESRPKENLTISNENNKLTENAPLNDFTLPKEIKPSVTPIEIKPKPIVPPPISRPKGFDPYREALQ